MISSDDLALIERSSNFSVGLLSREEKWSDERTHHAMHDTVLLPLLAAADECWAYGLDEQSEVFEAARTILHKEGRRHRVALHGDPIAGRELFWNAYGGKRGTIAIAIPVEKFNAATLFAHCRSSFVVTNYRSGHSAGAISYAQRKIQDRGHIVCCLPRNNGSEWMEVFAPQPLVFELFKTAASLRRGD
ncbi:hypothetical protein ACDW_01410 [Acidovorax sp. DW039]|uniref:hypothetical protein n=1 Tax=Acidovorax sp. DW039 TaxID=3095606 RepID=UPI003091C069|nr:hypothetical protein ACDW_01410 [Acidovorax sp. DW039]